MGSPHVPFQIPNIQSQLENLNVRSNSPASKDYAEEINFYHLHGCWTPTKNNLSKKVKGKNYLCNNIFKALKALISIIVGYSAPLKLWIK